MQKPITPAGPERAAPSLRARSRSTSVSAMTISSRSPCTSDISTNVAPTASHCFLSTRRNPKIKKKMPIGTSSASGCAPSRIAATSFRPPR